MRGDLKGLHSTRVNDQWRIVFRWTETSACRSGDPNRRWLSSAHVGNAPLDVDAGALGGAACAAITNAEPDGSRELGTERIGFFAGPREAHQIVDIAWEMFQKESLP